MVQEAKSRSLRSRPPQANDEFLSFTASVQFDHRLWRHDIAGSIAHAHALARAGVIDEAELESIQSGLREIAAELKEGRAALDPSLEDVHMNIEKLLTDRIGDAGAKLHTGRSRNDQVALDMRLMTRESLLDVSSKILQLQEVLLTKAKDTSDSIMPGYTHMQPAQPVLLAHHLLAHYWRLERDLGRLLDCYKRTNLSPLGAGAVAGTAFAIDREAVADMLSMDGVTQNSMDSVSDRDFVAEAAFALSLMMVHLSSLSEELVMWSSREFGFVRFLAGLTGGSSMMPQKQNPDIAELARGKSGRAIGDLVAVLTLLKSLPLAYNRDLQEDKESLFDVFDTSEASLRALTRFLAGAEFDKVRMRKAAEAGLMTATDLADLLAIRGVPFRKAHGLVREATLRSKGDHGEFLKRADELLVKELPDLDANASETLTAERSIARRGSTGGTSKGAVAHQLSVAEEMLGKNRGSVEKLMQDVSAVDRLLWA
ncbi:MAG: argininosuccinate lyase [Thermoplasmata archaeon]|jgi:argininosuccinate lyase|nr:argininosuccinate lyase [Thermoplasmata archaeon]